MPTTPPISRQTTSQPAPEGTDARSNTSVRWHWNSALTGALIAAILLGGFVLIWRRPAPSPIVVHAPPTPMIATPAATATPAPVVIFVSGAVVKPGVYELPTTARVVDALSAAGGFTLEANVNAVNQAAPLRDGDQIYVPTMAEEAVAPRSGIVSIETPEAEDELSAGGLININTATAAELETLPGIGEARAQDIIANRPYASVDELERVPGIGPAILEDLRPLVVVE